MVSFLSEAFRAGGFPGLDIQLWSDNFTSVYDRYPTATGKVLDDMVRPGAPWGTPSRLGLPLL